MGTVFDAAKYILEKRGAMSTMKLQSSAIILRYGLWYGMTRPCSMKILRRGLMVRYARLCSIIARGNFLFLPAI